MSDIKLTKLLCVTFVAAHLPLFAVGAYGLINGFTETAPILGLLLVSTVMGAVLSLSQVYLAYQGKIAEQT